jgi:hypothetical protein
METAPLKVPAFGGLRVTVIVQDFPAPTLPSQVFVCKKSLGSPVIVMLVIVSIVLPTLVSVVGRVLVWPMVTSRQPADGCFDGHRHSGGAQSHQPEFWYATPEL